MTDENVTIFSEEEISEAAKRDNITPMRAINLNEYPSLTMDGMKKDLPTPIEMVLSPILPKQGIGWIYAPAGVGKTFFSLNLAYAIAAGGEFLKYKCPKPRKVLYVDGEMPYNQIHPRLVSIEQQHGSLDFDDNFHIWTQDRLAFPIPKMDDLVGQEIYKKKLLDEGFEVVVFDNLSALSLVDTNKGVEVKPVMNWLVSLRHAGLTVITVHHAGKGGEYRGASELIDFADFAIQLTNANEEELSENPIHVKKIKISYKKNRGFHGEDCLSYEAQFFNGKWTHQSIKTSVIDKIRELLLLGMNQRDIAKEIGYSLGQTNTLIRNGRKDGVLPRKD